MPLRPFRPSSSAAFLGFFFLFFFSVWPFRFFFPRIFFLFWGSFPAAVSGPPSGRGRQRSPFFFVILLLFFLGGFCCGFLQRLLPRHHQDWIGHGFWRYSHVWPWTYWFSISRSFFLEKKRMNESSNIQRIRDRTLLRNHHRIFLVLRFKQGQSNTKKKKQLGDRRMRDRIPRQRGKKQTDNQKKKIDNSND